MILEIIQNKPSFRIDAYLINQIIDVALWAWILLIMIKRVLCRGFDLTFKSIAIAIRSNTVNNLLRRKFKLLVRQRDYYSDVLLLLAALVAVIKFSNQFYYHTVNLNEFPNLLSRTIPWMIFHKLLTVSILIKYRRSQPRIFTEIYEEIKRVKIWK